MTDEEINDILFTLESDDEGAEDILENVTDEDSDSDYEPIAEDLVDDDELIENIYREEQLRNVKSEKRKPGKKSKIGGSRSKPMSSTSKEIPASGSVTENRDSVTLVGKNGYVWSTQPINSSKGQSRSKNIIHVAPGPLNNALLVEIILNYNETKGGVDVFIRLCQDMNTGRKTKRWPMAFFLI